ncbi:S1/P1 nuclease [Trichoderma compactum]
MKILIELVVLGLVSLPGAMAWGPLGHQTAAYVATYFVTNSTAAYFKDLLDNKNDDYLASVAVFADDIKDCPEGKFTKNFHFIDAHDKPYKDCNVDYERDCKKDGCVISALTNYTKQAIDRELPEDDRRFAVKLLVHFIGDLHQPLHNEDVGKGGTEIWVKWQSQRRTLHSVWDSSIPEEVAEHLNQRRKRPALEWALEWANELSTEISNGKFAGERNSWLKSFDLSDPLKTAMHWSNEANDIVCSHVFYEHYGPEEIKHKELSDEYYEKAAPVAEKQIARAGYRMAAWLNEIARNNWGGEGNAEL